MVTRRRLLASLLALAGGGMGGGAAVGWFLRRERARREAAVLALAQALPESAGEVGARFLAGLDPPPTRPALARELAEELAADADGHTGAGAQVAAAQAAAAVRADFAAGRTVVVGGWVLAATEARLYALRALTDAEGGVKAGRH